MDKIIAHPLTAFDLLRSSGWAGLLVLFVSFLLLIWSFRLMLLSPIRRNLSPFLLAVFLPFLIGVIGFLARFIKLCRSLGHDDRFSSPITIPPAIAESLFASFFGAIATTIFLLVAIVLSWQQYRDKKPNPALQPTPTRDYVAGGRG
jgi:hypothetical protein